MIYVVLSGGNCSSTLEDKLVKIQKRSARVNLDCELCTPSSELFKLNWQTFPERVTNQKAILMYRIINNICPDYLKKNMSHILLTYHGEILDLLTVPTIYAKNCELHSCTLELPSGILSPYMLNMQLRLTLLNLKYIRLLDLVSRHDTSEVYETYFFLNNQDMRC